MGLADYPRREAYFAHRFLRLLTKTAAAQELRPEVCWLLTVVAMQEDSKRYTEPAKWYLEQLAPICGFKSKQTLVTAIGRAVEEGWLVYFHGSKTRPGRFWVSIPERFTSLDDGPCDESALSPKNGRNALRIADESLTNPLRMGSASIPVPVPVPRPNKRQLVELFNAWYQLYPRKKAKGKAIIAHDKALERIADEHSISIEEAADRLLAWTAARVPQLQAGDPQFTPYPATWLNAESYADELAPAIKAESRYELIKPKREAVG